MGDIDGGFPEEGCDRLEVELERNLRKPAADRERGKAEAGAWAIDRGRDRSVVRSIRQVQCALAGVTGAEAMQGMVEEVEGCVAEAQLAFAAQGETLLERDVGVEEGGAVQIGQDALAVGPDLRHTQTGGVDVLVWL